MYRLFFAPIAFFTFSFLCIPKTFASDIDSIFFDDEEMKLRIALEWGAASSTITSEDLEEARLVICESYFENDEPLQTRKIENYCRKAQSKDEKLIKEKAITSSQANPLIDPEVREACLPAADFLGCVKAFTTKEIDIQSPRVIQGKREFTGTGESLKNNSETGSYLTGSIGGSLVGDIEDETSGGDIEFDTGLGLDLGFGYDFGTTRAEVTWSRGAASGATWQGLSSEVDTTINSIVSSLYWDFRNGKKWSPFIGPSVAITSVEAGGASESSTAWGLGFGLSYKTSDNIDLFYKSQTLIAPKLDDFDGWDYENVYYTNGTIGVRYRL